MESNLSTQGRAQCEALLDAYDLSFVKEHMEGEGMLVDDDFEKTEYEFKRFMKLVLSEEGPIAVFDRRVDELWHSFILFTPQYQEFCDDVMGFFVHHQPRTSKTPVPEIAVQNFVSTYRRRFGELDPFWTDRIDPKLRDQISSGLVFDLSQLRWSGWTGRPRS